MALWDVPCTVIVGRGTPSHAVPLPSGRNVLYCSIALIINFLISMGTIRVYQYRKWGIVLLIYYPSYLPDSTPARKSSKWLWLRQATNTSSPVDDVWCLWHVRQELSQYHCYTTRHQLSKLAAVISLIMILLVHKCDKIVPLCVIKHYKTFDRCVRFVRVCQPGLPGREDIFLMLNMLQALCKSSVQSRNVKHACFV